MRNQKIQCPDCQQFVNTCTCANCGFNICGQHQQLVPKIKGL